MTIGAVYGVSNLKVDFSIEYFVDKGSPISFYLDANKEYFQNGSPFTIFVENKDLDYASMKTQTQF